MQISKQTGGFSPAATGAAPVPAAPVPAALAEQIAANYQRLAARVRQLGGEQARLVAVSKYTSDEAVATALAAGCAEFGENHVQNLARRAPIFAAARWHMIGNLQKNKINHMLRARPVLWQSCASLEQALAVDARMAAAGAQLECLVELNAAGEASKHGARPGEAAEIYAAINERCTHLRAVGIMSIGAHTQDAAAVRASFAATRAEFERCSGAQICSMGMSADYELALECGSTMVRLGSLLFS